MSQTPTVVEFLTDLERARGAAEASVAIRIIAHAEACGLRHQCSRPHPTKGIMYMPRLPGLRGYDAWVFGLVARTAEGLVPQLKELSRHPPFSDPARLEELRTLAFSIPGAPWDRKPFYPSLTLAALEDSGTLTLVLALIEWIVTQVREAHELAPPG